MSRLTVYTSILLCLAALTASASAQTPTKAVKFTGEVTGSDVYVRCGEDQNYYPVIKLNAGDRVTVVGEKLGWYEILPPKGCFSLIHKTYVDLDRAGKTGVVNGDAVRVRAGSVLDPSQRYQPQTKLNTGAEVQIIEVPENDDFLRIVPPKGATVWISADFVNKLPGTETAANAPKAATTESTTETETGTATPAATNNEDNEPGIVSATPSTTETAEDTTKKERNAVDYREEIDALEIVLKDELKKPLIERDLAPVIAQFKTLAEQDKDTFSKAYATSRLSQLEAMAETIAAVKEMRSLAGDVVATRKEHLDARTNLTPIVRNFDRGFDASGLLRISKVWADWSGPPRYRLTDPKADVARTLCYVEIPEDSGIKIEEFLGRNVGVWASERYLQSSGEVDLIPIVVADRIVSLDKPVKPVKPEHASAEALSGTQKPTPQESTEKKTLAEEKKAEETKPEPKADSDSTGKVDNQGQDK